MDLNKKIYWIVVFFVFSLSVFLLGFMDSNAQPMEWTMVDVNKVDLVGDAHLLRFPDGKIYLIDVGYEGGGLVQYLEKRKIKKIDKVFITHFHKDHYGELFTLLKAKISIREVYANLPDQEICDNERPWGCDFPHILKTLDLLKQRKVSIKPVRAGEIFYNKDGTFFEALYAFDGVHTPVGKTDINDTSLIMLLTHGKIKALFTGDLNYPIGEYLSVEGQKIEADILKIPHHGAEQAAPNDFFNRVQPKTALVPTPKNIWLSDRCKRIREYLEQKKVDTYVTGLHGDVTVFIKKDKYWVEANHFR
ncbi:MAG: MBL fold metallo-hydrolase [Thermodesulfobacteriota bacterium]